MPIRKRSGGLRKRRGMRKGRARGRAPRRVALNSMRDRASVVEVHSETDLSGGNGYTQNFNLLQFPRASAVAANYRYFRATKILLEFVPYANVFAPGTSFPELYYQKDYTEFSGQGFSSGRPAVNKVTMEGRGVLPEKWTRTIVKQYKPAVLRFEQLMVQSTGGSGAPVTSVQPMSATPVLNKWYQSYISYIPQLAGAGSPVQVGPAQDPMELTYGGSAVFINSPLSETGVLGRLVIKVHWEFKEPLVNPH